MEKNNLAEFDPDTNHMLLGLMLEDAFVDPELAKFLLVTYKQRAPDYYAQSVLEVEAFKENFNALGTLLQRFKGAGRVVEEIRKVKKQLRQATIPPSSPSGDVVD
jgi:hypothetical protein